MQTKAPPISYSLRLTSMPINYKLVIPSLMEAMEAGLMEAMEVRLMEAMEARLMEAMEARLMEEQ